MDLPAGSVSERRRAGEAGAGPEDVEADKWFEDWDREGSLLEDARYLAQWDQTIALLKQYRDVATDKPWTAFHTNEFLPN